jgi:hypothetical protein
MPTKPSPRRPKPDPGPTAIDLLGPAGRALWAAISDAYVIEGDPAAEALLLVVCREADRAEEADELVRTHGMSYTDRAGVLRVNVFVRIGREARLAMTRAMRALGLDLEPVRDRVGRPFGGNDAD